MNASHTRNSTKAQALAYDAYDAEEDEAPDKTALALDPENVDAVLFQAEMASSGSEAEGFYQKAMELGEAQFDSEPKIPWGLVTNRPNMRAIFTNGIWLYENVRFNDYSLRIYLR